jgi:hypothetical protein
VSAIPHSGPHGLAEAAREAVDAHADQHRPLGGYALLTATFNAVFVAFLIAAGRSDRLPERYDLRDLLLLGAATYKSSRLLAKDRVTSFLRAPFTRFVGDSGHGEVEEEARGRGVQRAMGELVVCEYCLAQWVAATFIAGLAVAPRATRAAAAMFTVFGISDLLQLAYSAAEQRA